MRISEKPIMFVLPSAFHEIKIKDVYFLLATTVAVIMSAIKMCNRKVRVLFEQSLGACVFK